MWPESLSIGRLRERPAAQDARCRYAGCRDVEIRVYESKGSRKRGVKNDLWPLCLKHAIRWENWDAERRNA